MTANSGLFPRFRLKVSEDEVPVEMLERRARFAAGPLARRMAEPDKADVISPEDFGRKMVELHGKDWPAMIGLAAGAAMKAERDAIAAADKVEGRG